MRLLHISDTHSYADGSNDAVAVASCMGVQLVHTGDMVQDYYQQGVDYLDMDAIWPVLGNHDTINQSGTDPAGYHWHDKPSQADLRARYFDGYPARGLVFPTADATWWHKDVDGCRIIGLDITALGNDLTKQLTWLRSTLNTMPTLVLSHIGPRGLHYTPNSFTNMAYWSDPSQYDPNTDAVYPAIAQLSNTVFSHAELYNVPVCMLCGHEHADGIIVHKGIPIITVGSTVQDKYNNVYRSTSHDTSRLVANLVTFDKTGVTVQRLGADGRTTGSRAKMWVYSYVEQRVTAIVST